MAFDYGPPDSHPSRTPGVRNPFARESDADKSEFGVGRGYQARQARNRVPVEDGGPYRAKAPSRGLGPRRAGVQSGDPGVRKRR